PLEYHLRTYDNVLVMRVFNPTDSPIELLGTQGAVVDPRGESHPLRERTIAPQSYIKLLFPPPRPTYYYPAGPTLGIGLGTRIGVANHGPLNDFWYPELYPSPQYLRVYDAGNFHYWSWDDQGEVRMTLAYRSAQSDQV